MVCTITATEKAPAAIGPYSQAVSTGGFVFVSGQLGIDPQTGDLVSPDFELQARQALENVKHIVIASGCQMSHVVSVDIYISNISNFKKLNELYKEYFEDPLPARAVVEVSCLPKNAGVEIKCIVCKQ
jgi:2-iminobutanoate/2-iminopropanoate deaminase